MCARAHWRNGHYDTGGDESTHRGTQGGGGGIRGGLQPAMQQGDQNQGGHPLRNDRGGHGQYRGERSKGAMHQRGPGSIFMNPRQLAISTRGHNSYHDERFDMPTRGQRGHRAGRQNRGVPPPQQR